MNYLRQLTSPTDRAMAATRAEGWGYGRHILPEEHKRGIWFEYGDVGLVWFLNGPIERSMQAHTIAAPGCGLVWLTEEHLAIAKGIAQLLLALKDGKPGARLYSVNPVGHPAGLRAKGVARLLRIKGWKQDEWGSYLELGGE